MRSTALAMRRDADIAAAATRLAEAADASANNATAAGSIQRVSRGEVRILTAAPQVAPVRSATRVGDKQFKPLVRLSIASEQPAEFKPMVRFDLPAAKSAASGSAPAKAAN
jgi:hypothetical protein